MLWFLLSVLGFVVLTAVVIAMARSDTARWEREKTVRRPVSGARDPAGTVPPHARRRRVELPTHGLPVARRPVAVEAAPRHAAPVGAGSAEGPAAQEVS